MSNNKSVQTSDKKNNYCSSQSPKSKIKVKCTSFPSE